MERPVGIICHGGAGRIDRPDEYATGLVAPLEEGYRLLRQGAHALEVAVRVVQMMEDNPVFNAGTGSHPNIEGACEMDAAVMTQDGRFGSVACISAVRNPVLVAERVMIETDHLILSGTGAVAFARRLGFAEYDPGTSRGRERLGRSGLEGSPCYPRLNKLLHLSSSVDNEVGGGGVGTVTMDRHGKVAAAVSTGGIVGRLPGCISDAAVPGAGIYAAPSGAVCCTGHGEEILRLMLARSVVEKMQTLSGMAATVLAMAEAKRRKVPCGLIGFDARGAVCYGNAACSLAYGYKVADRLFLFNQGLGRGQAG